MQTTVASVVARLADCLKCVYNRDTEDGLHLQPKRAQTRWVSLAEYQAPLTHNLVPSISLCIMWSTIELGTAIICACVPTYRPLLHGSWFGDWLASARHSARGTSSTTVVPNSSHNGYGDVRAGYNRFTDDTNSDKIFLNEVVGGTRVESNEPHFYPLNAITVERRIEVS